MSDPRRVLVVDDDEEIRAMTGAILSSAGYEAVTAASGEDALARVRASAFDLVLLDINMPGMDGWQTLKLLRADAALAGLPVVMFSVKSEFRDRIHGIQEGAIDYIVKPFVVDELIVRVERALEAAGRGGAPRSATVPAR